MINKYISTYLKYLVSLKVISEKDIRSYEYELLRITETTIVIIAMVVMGVIFHCVMNSVIFMVCFFLIRNRAGGFHLETFSQCFIGTIILEVVGIFLIMKLPNSFYWIFDVITFFSFIFIVFFGTLNHSNMDFSLEEYRSVKKISRFIVSMICALILFLKWINASAEIILSMEYAVVLSGMLLLLGIITRQHKKIDK